MRAIMYQGKGKLELQEIPQPTIKPNEVLLKVKAVGICGTDLHIYNGGTDVPPGTVIGHEFSGEVVAVGADVTNVQVGDRAVAEHVVTCGECFYCKRGTPNLCNKRQVLGMDLPGALAEYMAIPANLVYTFPATIPYDVAALIEPLTIALFAQTRLGSLAEKKVAVIGQGPIGLFLDQVLRLAGAEVIGMDVLDNRLTFAKTNGWIAHALNTNDSAFTEQLAKIAPLGVDATFEAVGRPETATLALEITRPDGDVVLLGVFEQPVSLNLMRLIRKELHVHGSWTCAFSFPPAIELLQQNKVELASLITHRYTLEDTPRAFVEASTYSDNRIKTVITLE
jgi:2-desacetyl-2-hydroxyethyl bacteriochlorophyllide A dehydrogenase